MSERESRGKIYERHRKGNASQLLGMKTTMTGKTEMEEEKWLSEERNSGFRHKQIGK